MVAFGGAKFSKRCECPSISGLLPRIKGRWYRWAIRVTGLQKLALRRFPFFFWLVLLGSRVRAPGSLPGSSPLSALAISPGQTVRAVEDAPRWSAVGQ